MLPRLTFRSREGGIGFKEILSQRLYKSFVDRTSIANGWLVGLRLQIFMFYKILRCMLFLFFEGRVGFAINGILQWLSAIFLLFS